MVNPKEKSRSLGYRPMLALVFLLVVGGALRVGLVYRQGLWADECFSLAMVTGHSMEQPADQADPAQGDYVELPTPVLPAEYSRYLDHDHPPASLARVVRAVFLSETSPPGYYVLLYGWTRVLGTGDAALRLFSVLWALACIPVIWSLARRLGGRAAQWPTGILFILSPVCVYYSTEGRMYSMVWFWAVSTTWLTVDLRRRGFRGWTYALWVAVGALGLLTHYFFAFVWLAAVAWLMLTPGRFARWLLIGGVFLIGLLILPWYVHLPESISHWRVTANWLTLKPKEDYDPVATFLALGWSYFAVAGYWGVRPIVDGINAVVLFTLACVVLAKHGRALWSRRRLLLWAWAGSACLGIAIFDLWRGTYAASVPRYVLAGLPGALLLCGFALGKLRPGPRRVFLTLIVLISLIGVRRMYLDDGRVYEPLDDLGRILTDRAGSSDLVIVHSVPTGVAGIARYMDRHGASAKGIGFASWVGQLRQRRVPEDLQRLAAGRRQVILVKIHDVDEPAPEETWLQDHARLARFGAREEGKMFYFVPKSGPTFFPARDNRGQADPSATPAKTATLSPAAP